MATSMACIVFDHSRSPEVKYSTVVSATIIYYVFCCYSVTACALTSF